MSANSPDRFNEQLEKTLMGPTRAFMGLGVEHLEKLINVQLEATKAYTQLGLQQARAALEIRQPKDLESYVQGQQKAAQTLGERIKGDTEMVVALNREFTEKAQQLVQENPSGFGTSARQ